MLLLSVCCCCCSWLHAGHPVSDSNSSLILSLEHGLRGKLSWSLLLGTSLQLPVALPVPPLFSSHFSLLSMSISNCTVKSPASSCCVDVSSSCSSSLIRSRCLNGDSFFPSVPNSTAITFSAALWCSSPTPKKPSSCEENVLKYSWLTYKNGPINLNKGTDSCYENYWVFGPSLTRSTRSCTWCSVKVQSM